jgi:hypothetical protein
VPGLERRPFAFQPPIGGIEHNEWLLQRSTWTELEVLNTHTWEAVLVPARYVSGIRRGGDGSQTVVLIEALECRHGRVLPVRRGVLEMRPARETPVARRQGRPAPVVGIRLEEPSESRARRALRGSIAVGFLACLSVIFVVRDVHLGTRLGLTTAAASSLPLEAGDDYFAVVNKLGRPASDRWVERSSGNGYRRLWYPRRRMAVILEGETRDSARYVRTVSRDAAVLWPQ